MVSTQTINAAIDRILLVPISSLLSIIEVLYYLANLLYFSHSTFTQLTLRLCTSLIILSLPISTGETYKVSKRVQLKNTETYSKDLVVTLMSFLLLFCEFSFMENIKWAYLSIEEREILIFDFILESLWRFFILDFVGACFISKILQGILSVRLLSVIVQNDWHLAMRFRFLSGGILIGLTIFGIEKLKDIRSYNPSKDQENKGKEDADVTKYDKARPSVETSTRHTESKYTVNFQVENNYVPSIKNLKVSLSESIFDLDRLKFTKQTSMDDGNLARVLDFLPEGVIVLDLKGKVQFANQYMRNIFEFDGKISLQDFSNSLSDFRFREACFQNSCSLNIISEASDYSPKQKHRKISQPSCSKPSRSEFLQRVQRFSSLEVLIMSCIENIEAQELVEKYIPTFQTRYYQRSTEEWYTIEMKVHLLSRSEKQFVILLRDITNRENKIVALEKEKTLYRDNLIASFSHELRTPLNSNLAFLEQSMDSLRIPTDIKNDLIKPALDSGRLLLFMVNNILDYSLLILNQLRLDIKALDITQTVSQCMELFEAKTLQKKLQLNLFLEDDIPSVVFSDHKRISQVLVNLLSNAIQFTTQGEIQVRISRPSEQTIRITVQDTGIGMEAIAQERLVRSLSNEVLKEKLSEASVGSGLGLFISNKLVKSLNLDEQVGIKFKSNYNRGSKFYFDIKDQRPKEHIIDLRIKKNVSSELDEKCDLASRFKRYNSHFIKNTFNAVKQGETEQVSALVVDDEIFNIKVIENYCKSLGIATDKAFNGKEAVDKLKVYSKGRSNPIKIVFMDINMPLMDGYESTLAILDMIKKGELEDVIIIGVTAYVSRDMIEKGLECGMMEVLNKPVTKEGLMEVLRKYKLIK